MATTPLLPQAFWFRLAIPCRHVSALPGGDLGEGGDDSSKLLRLDADCTLPATPTLEGEEAWAEVRAGWNAKGLAVQVDVKQSSFLDSKQEMEPGPGFRVWVDTRDTRDVSRATRFCHCFVVRIVRGKTKTAPLEVEVKQLSISRAVADAPLAAPKDLLAHAERLKQGWRVSLFLLAGALNGFDPDTNRRLGITYQISDYHREDQFLGAGRAFPLGDNPSLWTTLELRD